VARTSVVVVHNHYQQPGGEDQVVNAEVALLRSFGHETIVFSLENSAIEHMSGIELARSTFWNNSVYRQLRKVFRDHAPLTAHFHNTFPLVSPAAYYAAHAEGVPVVQTLHNFRIVCPNGLLFRSGHTCEDCIGRSVAWPAVVHACYRESRTATALSTAMIAAHRARGTWTNAVDMYIALSEFARDRFAKGGLPSDRIAVKPNFLASDPGVGAHSGGYALFVGRLSPEKGLQVLVDAWDKIGAAHTLKIVGDGPLADRVRINRPGVEWLGRQPTERVLALMKDASFLLVPSECYENFPVTIVEAFATGLPVVVSGIGSLAELVRPHETGLHFRAGDPSSLAESVDWAFTNEAEMRAMGARGRQQFEARYGPAQNYARLLEIYERAAARTNMRARA
jgi:glycosyltransferase involved in cell wall biosynthesis